jgi:hypothetical protein
LNFFFKIQLHFFSCTYFHDDDVYSSFCIPGKQNKSYLAKKSGQAKGKGRPAPKRHVQRIDYLETLILSGRSQDVFTVSGKIKQPIREYIEQFVPQLVEKGIIKDNRNN